VEDLVAGGSKIRVAIVGLSPNRGLPQSRISRRCSRFDAAVKRHGLIDAIVRASTTGNKQRLDRGPIVRG
jgi:hypothetical protein